MDSGLSKFWVKFRTSGEREQQIFSSAFFDEEKFREVYPEEALSAVREYYHHRGNGAEFGNKEAIEKMNNAAAALKGFGIDIDELDEAKNNARTENLE